MSRKVAWAGGSVFLCAVCTLAWLALPAGAQSRGGAAALPRAAPSATTQPAAPMPANPPVAQEVPVPPPPPPVLPPRPREVPAVRLQATIYQVELPPESLVDLDSSALAAVASSPAALAQTLQKFGTATVLYRIDQTVAAEGGRGAKIAISQNVPYPAGGQNPVGGGGPSIARERAGVTFDVYALATENMPANHVQASVEIDLAAMSGTQALAPTFWHMSQSYGGLTELGKPIVLVSADGSRGNGTGQSLAFVTLLQLTKR